MEVDHAVAKILHIGADARRGPQQVSPAPIASSHSGGAQIAYGHRPGGLSTLLCSLDACACQAQQFFLSLNACVVGGWEHVSLTQTRAQRAI